MKAFVEVVERRSFSAAADALALTPSAVSKLITRLEDRLGVRLLHRTTRRLALTTEGEFYFGRARQIVADIAEAETEVARARGAPRGLLQVNTSNAFMHQLAPALREFLVLYPEIKLELSITDRIVDLVAEHADVTIRVGNVRDESMVARKFAETERVVCAAPSYLKQHGAPRNPADLANHLCVVMAAPALSRWSFRMRDGVEIIEIAPRVTTDNGEGALQLALAGAGIVRLGDIIVAEPIRRGLLVPLLREFYHPEPVPVSALHMAGRHRLPKLRVFLDFLVARFANSPWRVTPSA